MKSYKKKVLLNISIGIIAVGTLIFFYLLTTIKLWTYKEANILSVDNNLLNIFTDGDLDIFKDNNFFYYNNLKYSYIIQSIDSLKEGNIITLKLNKDFKLFNNDILILLPNIKKNIFSLIIESWRVEWKN